MISWMLKSRQGSKTNCWGVMPIMNRVILQRKDILKAKKNKRKWMEALMKNLFIFLAEAWITIIVLPKALLKITYLGQYEQVKQRST